MKAFAEWMCIYFEKSLVLCKRKPRSYFTFVSWVVNCNVGFKVVANCNCAKLLIMFHVEPITVIKKRLSSSVPFM